MIVINYVKFAREKHVYLLAYEESVIDFDKFTT